MVRDAIGRPLAFFLSPGQMRGAKGALVLLGALPPASQLVVGARALQATIQNFTNSATGLTPVRLPQGTGSAKGSNCPKNACTSTQDVTTSGFLTMGNGRHNEAWLYRYFRR
jgi:hypothetical protein